MEAQPSGAAGEGSSSPPEAEVRDHFVPMRGWRSVADCDLLAAVEPLAHVVPEVRDFALDALEFAARRLKQHGGGDRDRNGLDAQQIAALNLYTKENIGDSRLSFHAVLNLRLHSRDRSTLIPFLPYLKLFFGAAQALPNAGPCKVWRGLRNMPAGGESAFQIGLLVHWWGVTSTTRSAKVLANPRFFGSSGARTLFMVDCILAVEISDYSDYPEEEVLLMPGACLEVEQLMPPEITNGVLQVVMKQVPSRHDILGVRAEPSAPRPELLLPEPAAVAASAPPAHKVDESQENVEEEAVDTTSHREQHVSTDEAEIVGGEAAAEAMPPAQAKANVSTDEAETVGGEAAEAMQPAQAKARARRGKMQGILGCCSTPESPWWEDDAHSALFTFAKKHLPLRDDRGMPVVQRHRRGFRLRMIRLSPPLDDHTMIALAELLDGVNVLEIFMQGNKVGDGGARALAQATLLCPRLRCVVVSDNQIGELGQRALAEAVAAGRQDPERQRLDRHHLRVVGIGKQRAQLLPSGGESELVAEARKFLLVSLSPP